MLQNMGFSGKWICWIVNCIHDPCFSILLNGSPMEFFKGNRRLRQGDPLSPYLFTLVIEAFTIKLELDMAKG